MRGSRAINSSSRGSESGGVEVQHAEPGDGGLLDERLEEIRERAALSPTIASPMPQVLRDEVQLASALCLEELRLAHHIIERERSMFPPHQGNRTKRTSVIAPFADLQVSDMREVPGVEPHTGMRLRSGLITQQPAVLEGWNQLIDLGGPEEDVDFREGLGQLDLVPLDQAADPNDGPAPPGVLEPAGFDERIDRFLLCRIDEPAAIDHDDVRLRQVCSLASAPWSRELGQDIARYRPCSCRSPA